MSKETKININGETYWFDYDLYCKEQEYMKQKEAEYWKWHFSGQRTIDLFGVEGAKVILAAQDERDRLAREEDGSNN